MFILKCFSLLDRLRNWRPGKLAHDTLTMSASMGARAVLQGGVFLIIARVLGVSSYGKFAAVLALSSALSGFVGFGTPTLMVKNVARAEDCFAESWGQVLYGLAISIPLALFPYLFIAIYWLPPTIPIAVVVLIGMADIGFAPVTTVSMIAFQSHEKIQSASRLLILSVSAKLLAALLLLLLRTTIPQEQRLLSWSFFYALTNLATACYSMSTVHHDLGKPSRPPRKTLWPNIRSGLPFSINGVALRLYADIDKTMLARLSTLSVVGAYSAGYRVTDMASLPCSAFFVSALPRFFRAGGGGLEHAIRESRRMLPVPIAYALLAGICLSSFSDFLPIALGPGYYESAAALRWLAWLPLISLLRMFLQTILVSSEYQLSAVSITVIGAIGNIVLNLRLIRSWQWHGAVLATYLSELLMLLLMAGVLILQLFNKRPSPK